MERFTSRKTQSGQPAAKQPAAAPAQPNTETFSEMANATALKSGVVGKLLVVSLIVVSIAITAFVGYAIVRGVGGNNLIKSDQYQAVFLTDGQIYFGKLSSLSSDWVVLEDIYYLQVQQEVQPDTSTEPQAQISLAKLGNELHGPEDQMFINPSEILFWENLKDDGQVVQAITDFVENGGEANNNNGDAGGTAPAGTPQADENDTPADGGDAALPEEQDAAN